MTKLHYPKSPSDHLPQCDTLLLLAPAKAYKAGWHRKVLPQDLASVVTSMTKGAESGDMGQVLSSVGGSPRQVHVAVLPDKVSRHNSPARTEAIARASQGRLLVGKCAVIACLDKADHLDGVLIGVARKLYLFNRKTGSKPKQGRVSFSATNAKGTTIPVSAYAKRLADSVRFACRLVDTHTEEMTTAQFVKEARAHLRGMKHVTTKVIVGDQLLKEKLGGIHGVGRAAQVAPRLLIMDYKPPRVKEHVALVGKGVVYDTGGLNIKVAGHMSTMKADMGGAAATLGAFAVLAGSGVKRRITALCPLAENAIDSASYRPDDILTMHSGHTVEINNTDAEGRLLLGDGVSYAARKFKPDVVINAATLTGAQLISTGHIHAAVVSNRETLESIAVKAGRESGDVCHPLLFAPEITKAEFKSEVADFRNSVKDRMNAQSSCAAQFVYNHIDDLDIPWLHIDLAGPAFRGARATGFGVALMAAVAQDVPQTMKK